MAAEPDRPRRGLIVDWGGVLTGDIFASFASFAALEGLAPGRIAEAFAADPRARALLIDFECGRLADAAFETELAEIHGLASGAGIVDRMFAGAAADEAMTDAVAAFRRAGVRTALLSNSWGADRYDRSRWPEMFDAVVVSGEHGIHKPEPAIYRVALEALGLPAGECVFVDDVGANLKPARAMGMATVKHADAASTIAELERLLGVRVGPAGNDPAENEGARR